MREKLVSAGEVRAWELQMIDTFIEPSRQKRWVLSLDFPEKRKRTVRLYDSRDFQDKYLAKVPLKSPDSHEMLTLLRAMGAKDEAVLVEGGINPSTMCTLTHALECMERQRVEDYLIICSPRHLLYLHTEATPHSLLLSKA